MDVQSRFSSKISTTSTTKSVELIVVGEPDPYADYRSWRAQFVVQNLLKRNYDKNIRPGTNSGKPVYVTTSLKVYSLSAVKEALMVSILVPCG